MQVSENISESDACFDALCIKLQGYLTEEHIHQVTQAYEMAMSAHESQRRLSGEPYIIHPIAVAEILADMGMDSQSIMAAILHDVLEDTEVTKELIEHQFGSDVSDLVDGVTKLTKMHFVSRIDAQAANFRKMLLAMVNDVRVILIKLADRLHNMRTLSFLPLEKRRRISRETLEIYAPIANRLGINTIRIELQELGFSVLYPMRYRVLLEEVKKTQGNRKEVIEKVKASIERRLEDEGIQGYVEGREKHIYSIYQKMHEKKLTFSEVFDVHAFRIVIDKAINAYLALGIVHNLYSPVPGRFKDYIAIPKKNGYQSLHTVLFGPFKFPIEVQIRTQEMHAFAESGIAAHWLYKSDDDDINRHLHGRVRQWMQGLLDLQRDAGSSLEFLENVKVDLFPEEVYVFTPKGEIMSLLSGATAVDFAYAVHTDVGNHCVAARIDHRLSPISTSLVNGQTIEIITSPEARPNPIWLNFVVTGKARSHIRGFLKKLQFSESVDLGRRLLNKALGEFGLTINSMPPGQLEDFLKELRLETEETLYAEIGIGNRLSLIVARQMAEKRTQPEGDDAQKSWTRYLPSWMNVKKALGQDPGKPKLSISGTEGMVVTYARCCRPIPGDSIMGIVTSGRGIVIHDSQCKNIEGPKAHPENCISVQWEDDIQRMFPVDIRLEARNKRGGLAGIASMISSMEADIEHVNVSEKDEAYSNIQLTISVQNRKHLATVLRRVKSIDTVSKVQRSRH